jgi:STAS-like domain of unknown function (DUF4325)
MTKPVAIQVRDFTGCPFAVSVEDGGRVHDAIAPALKEGTAVVLSFAGIETVIGAFLGAAIGRLHAEMASEDVDALLSIRCLEEEQMESLKRVVANSKRYFENPAAYEAAWKEVVDHEAG